MKAHLREALDELPERERQIIELRFGMKDDRPRTFEEVGPRVRHHARAGTQIQMKTLDLLREQRRTQNLLRYSTRNTLDTAEALRSSATWPAGRESFSSPATRTQVR